MRRARTISTGEAGFTLVELSVGMLVAGLVLSLALAVYPRAQRHVSVWREAVTADDALHLVLRRVSTDLQDTAALEIVSGPAAGFPRADTAYVLLRADGRRLVYAFADSALYRDGHPMHAAAVRVTAFALHPSRSDTRHAPLPGTEEAGRPPLLVRAVVTLRTRHHRRTAASAVAPRTARPWPAPPNPSPPPTP